MFPQLLLALSQTKTMGFKMTHQSVGLPPNIVLTSGFLFLFFASFSTGIRYKKFSLLMTNICLGMQLFFRHCVVFCVFLGGL